MVKKLKCWKRSQTGTGFYKKSKDKPTMFISFYRYKDGTYDVDKRVGVGMTKKHKHMATKKNKKEALRYAKSYMRKHDVCRR